MKENNILIFSSSYDFTVDYIINKFNSNCNFYRMNVDKFFDYKISINNNKTILCNNIFEVILSDINSIFYRKIDFPNLDDVYEKKYHKNIISEIYTVVTGFVESFQGICLTKPSILRLVDNKVYQLKVARDVNFLLPETLISNDYEMISNFTKGKNRIIKPISSGKIEDKNIKEVVQTNLVNSNYKRQIGDFCPSYYQDFIDKDFDLRVTIVNNDIFPVKIISNNKVDWRKSYKDIKYELFDLPIDIREKCFLFLKRVNMKFGVFDFVVKDNEYYFLEINANGQWAWLEKELNIDISSSLFNYLSEGI